ncbi:MAG: hypothetical protein ACXVXW_13650, partial [Mycobacteriaceae bacterium]
AAALETLQLDHSFRLARAESAARLGGRPPKERRVAAGGSPPTEDLRPGAFDGLCTGNAEEARRWPGGR